MDGTDVISLLQWVLRPVGILGVFYGCGFIIESAHQSLLGISQEHAPSAYLMCAGTFLLDVVVMLLKVIDDTPRWVAMVVLAGLAAGFAVTAISRPMLRGLRRHLTALPRRATDLCVRTNRRRRRAAVTLGGLVVLKLIYFDAPLIGFENLLFERVPTENHFLGYGGLIEDRAEAIWHDLVCAHTDKCDPGRDRDDYVRANRYRFLANVAVTIALVLAGAVLTRHPLARAARAAADGAEINLAIIATPLIIALLSVPYVYGKTLRSTHYRRTTVVQANDDELYGYLLSDGDWSVQLFVTHRMVHGEPTDEPAQIWQIPRAQIKAITLVSLDDILSARVIPQASAGG